MTTDTFPGPSQHEGHDLRFVMVGEVSYPIVGIHASGDVVHAPTHEVDFVTDSFIRCATCATIVTGEDIGAHPEWNAVSS